MAETINRPLQESLLCLLGHDDKYGRIVAHLVTADLFDGDYQLIAQRCLDYWRKHQTAPKTHVDDLLGDIVGDAKNPKARTFRDILTQMYRTHAEGINGEYVADRVQRFQRLQALKRGILDSANKINSKNDTALEEIEEIWADLMRVRQVNFDPGLRLTDIDPVLDYLGSRSDEFVTGIEQLDRRGVVPARDTVMMLLAGTGKGKSWGLIHLGKMALLQRHKVLHISLEMSREQVIQRYWQNLYSVPRHEAMRRTQVTTINTDSRDQMQGLEISEVTAEFSLSSELIRDELATRLMWGGNKLHNNFIVKGFPSGTMSARELNAYLDTLEATQGFIPDMIILDYLGLMKVESMDKMRLSLGRNLVDFRAICQDRHCAGVTAQQLSRQGASVGQASIAHIAEDWSLTNTSDTILIYSSTSAEKKFGLGRLTVAKARDASDDYTLLLTQNYGLGQFVLDSVPYEDNRDRKIKDEFTGAKDEDEESEEGEDDGDHQ